MDEEKSQEVQTQEEEQEEQQEELESNETQTEAVEPGNNKLPKTIPYSRFKEVNDEKKQYEREASELKAKLDFYEKQMLEQKQSQTQLSKSEKKRLDVLRRYSMVDEDRDEFEQDLRNIVREEYGKKMDDFNESLNVLLKENLAYKRERILNDFITSNKDEYSKHEKTMEQLIKGLPEKERERLANDPVLLRQYLPMFLSQAKVIESQKQSTQQRPVNTTVSKTKSVSGNVKNKIWTRAEIIKLSENIEEYQKMKPEIDLAFAEGRIK